MRIETIAIAVIGRGNLALPPKFRSPEKAASMIRACRYLSACSNSSIARTLISASTEPRLSLPRPAAVIGSGRQHAQDCGGHLWTALNRLRGALTGILARPETDAILFFMAFPAIAACFNCCDDDLEVAVKTAIDAGEIEIVPCFVQEEIPL